MRKSFNILLLFSLLVSLFSCTIKVKRKYPQLKGDLKSEQRVAYVKSFAVDLFAKCEKEDYTEMSGFKMDVNMAKRMQPENLKKLCYYYNKNYGVVTIGELTNADSNAYTKDFLDYFTFKAKGSKSDSLQSVRVQVYRDDNTIEGLVIPKYKPTNNKLIKATVK